MSRFMGWNIRTTYLYLVCFVTLVMVMLGTVQIIGATINFVYPAPVWSPGPLEIKERLEVERRNADPELVKEQIRLERERAELQQKHDGARRLGSSLALLVVALPVYLYHWRAIQQGERLEAGEKGQAG